MRPLFVLLVSAVGLVLPLAAERSTAGVTGIPGVNVKVDEAARRVDVTVDGKPFTSYIWPDTVKKPVLYPIRDAHGTLVTRGWPLDPRPGERVDHPHHVGFWLNYENVNGIDFWNNSDAIKPEDAPKMGTILHRRIVSATSGERGDLVTESDWVRHDGTTLLHERTAFVFRGDAATRTIDRTTTLTALDTRVTFDDAKDGMLGLRVARQLELPSTKPEVFTDMSGRPTEVPKLDNAGITGNYTTSDGKQGDDAWGTRGRWCLLTGQIGSDTITIAILDHPSNPGYPTYWHARNFGLFSANPLGQKIFSNGKETLGFALEPKQSVTFRYRVLIVDGGLTPERADREQKAFAQTGAAANGRR
ncbi:MAG TPA: PmoA family protein [Vicinamibacterales bacterium]